MALSCFHMLAGSGCLSEYLGVKPDEFVTVDKRSLQRSGQIIQESGTMKAANSCSMRNKPIHTYNSWRPTDQDKREEQSIAEQQEQQEQPTLTYSSGTSVVKYLRHLAKMRSKNIREAYVLLVR